MKRNKKINKKINIKVSNSSYVNWPVAHDFDVFDLRVGSRNYWKAGFEVY